MVGESFSHRIRAAIKGPGHIDLYLGVGDEAAAEQGDCTIMVPSGCCEVPFPATSSKLRKSVTLQGCSGVARRVRERERIVVTGVARMVEAPAGRAP